ncbi:MAG: hypothetical protein ACOX4N_00075 [Dethiobacteraceae bacterium]|jgi:hypothetical protein
MQDKRYAYADVPIRFATRLVAFKTGKTEEEAAALLKENESIVVNAMKLAALQAISELVEVDKSKNNSQPIEATVTLTTEDVLSLQQQDWSQVEAEKFLQWAKKQIEADMRERGLDSIQDLLWMYSPECLTASDQCRPE